MESLFDKLNLPPEERRLIIGVGLVVFVVLNLWLVWPHFEDWKNLRQDMADKRKQLAEYQTEVDRLPLYRGRVAQLENQGGTDVPSSDQAIHLSRKVHSQAQQSGVAIERLSTGTSTSRSGSATNAFFEEQTIFLTIRSGDRELVDYLNQLGQADSLIRVRDLRIRPDPSKASLVGTLVLVASYRKDPNTPTTADPAP